MFGNYRIKMLESRVEELEMRVRRLTEDLRVHTTVSAACDYPGIPVTEFAQALATYLGLTVGRVPAQKSRVTFFGRDHPLGV